MMILVSNMGDHGCSLSHYLLGGLGELSRECITESNILFYKLMNRLLKENVPMPEWKESIEELMRKGCKYTRKKPWAMRQFATAW